MKHIYPQRFPEAKEIKKEVNKKYLSSPKGKLALRRYRSRPEVKARVREYLEKNKEKLLAYKKAYDKIYYSRPDVKKRIRAYSKAYYSRPNVKKRMIEYGKKRYQKIKEEREKQKIFK